MGVISVPKDTPAKALAGNMEPDQALVKPTNPRAPSGSRRAAALAKMCAMTGTKPHRRRRDRAHASAPQPLPPSLSGSTAGSSMTFWPVAENVPDEAVLDVAEITPPRHGELKRNPNGTLTYIPDPAFTGIDRFGYTLADSEGNLYPASVTVSVESDDDAPEAADEPQTAASVESPQQQKPGIVDFSHGEHGTVALDGDGALVYTPEKGFVGFDSFSYTVCDEKGAETTTRVTVEIDRSGAYRVVRQSDSTG
jgi:hypothetical protein